MENELTLLFIEEHKIITGLLFIIALTGLIRLYMVTKGLSKKAHFKGKIKGTERMIWDMELKCHQIRIEREEMRKAYDNSLASVEALKVSVENFKGTKDDKGTLEDELTRAEANSKKLQDKLETLDKDLVGITPRNQYPDGVTGQLQQIDMLKDVIVLLKDYIKKV